jgi:hypothetical protein
MAITKKCLLMMVFTKRPGKCDGDRQRNTLMRQVLPHSWQRKMRDGKRLSRHAISRFLERVREMSEHCQPDSRMLSRQSCVTATPQPRGGYRVDDAATIFLARYERFSRPIRDAGVGARAIVAGSTDQNGRRISSWRDGGHSRPQVANTARGPPRATDHH